MDIRSFLQGLQDAGAYDAVMRSNVAQFGSANRPYVGAQFMPERPSANQFTERGIRYTTVVAVAGTRFSPATKRQGGQFVGGFDVKLGESDIERQLTAEDYDAVIDYLGQSGRGMQAAAENTVLNFSNAAINLALIEYNEIQRWQYWLDGRVIRVLPHGGQEVVRYPEPSGGGHRVTAGGNWSDNTYDPMLDIIGQADLLRDKGYEVTDIVTTNRVMAIMQNNEQVRKRAGGFTMVPDGAGGEEPLYGRTSRTLAAGVFGAEGLPRPQIYDRRYHTQISTRRFQAQGTMLFIADSGQSEEIVNDQDPEDVRFLPNVLGYVGIGRPAGRAQRGRAIDVQQHTDKPPRVEMDGWQTSLPVPQVPEASASIDGIQ